MNAGATRSQLTEVPGHRASALEPLQHELIVRCPGCGADAGPLRTIRGDAACRCCGFSFVFGNGILRALAPGRDLFYSRFITEYSMIRRAENRGSDRSDYYLALPYEDITGAHGDQWRMRGRTYRHFENHVLPLLEQGRKLDVLDLGAGTGWLSYRLSRRGHCPVAVDILTDSRDGLGAAHHYRDSLGYLFPLVQAEFDNIPFSDTQFDIAVFNSSLHYSSDYERTLSEIRRCLKSDGSVVVLDSPIYRRAEHGMRMRQERHEFFESRYGVRSESIRSIEFLDEALLSGLSERLGIRWQVFRPWYGWRWHLRPLMAAWKRQRPPSRFQILVGSWPE
jgi:ubiquinone/menaquinone biosynthesis C-methylase UbiE